MKRINIFLNYQLILTAFCLFGGFSCLSNPDLEGNHPIHQINGPNTTDLSPFILYWLGDNGYSTTIQSAQEAITKGEFRPISSLSDLNIGLNKTSLWLKLAVQNVSKTDRKYWWSLYSHADSVIVFKKTNELWQAYDTLVQALPRRKRRVQTRFLATEINLDFEEKGEYLMKIVNKTHTQNAYTDLTTPEHNLMFEKRFFWTIGFFVGAFLFVSSLALIVFFFIRDRHFLLFSLYTGIAVVIIVHQELFIPVFGENGFHDALQSLHSLPLSLLSLSIHFALLQFFIETKDRKLKNIFSLQLNKVLFLLSLVILCVFVLGGNVLNFSQPGFVFIWWATVTLIVISLLNNIFLPLSFEMNAFKKGMIILVLLTMMYFNLAGYYLNYAGILHYYEITYPNYYYWILGFELMLMASFVAWRYRQTKEENMNLMIQHQEQKVEFEEREQEIQKDERKRIASDLHDDLGTTLSAMKLLITNQKVKDDLLLGMVDKANKDLRSFFVQLPDIFDDEYLDAMLSKQIGNYSAMNGTKFEFITIGDARLIPERLKSPLFRICTELLTNILKHAKASESTIQLIVNTNSTQLIIEDNGIGFNFEKCRKNGMGLSNIEERCERWGGTFHVSSNPAGTTVIVELPLNTKKDEGEI